jgi:hypothetical protein
MQVESENNPLLLFQRDQKSRPEASAKRWIGIHSFALTFRGRAIGLLEEFFTIPGEILDRSRSHCYLFSYP